ncbi:transporter substrate-binding domain-containing protein [Clostridium sp. HV4-5-A1G]|mgnify:CR=1 FL=1|uniref:transporter substrate-binding domain-containing protein n=1 Tax=Clostridium sp. HV4-5-A1G TaxID=2004595 RepID=UPI00123ABE4F|nr:transporter substrate-binding domain-containing protein [Clostridium sp. HV4-5-A1G]KAA8679360.1 transporter substrate-binding domain-containing protein [Clostridium sp. HV4-5-A1G]CAB1262485.1 putative sulfur aminoacid ABC transporter (binding lipoprotein) [Clostridiaceae bacterium BL-3]
MKKLSIFIVTAILLLGLVGCGSKTAGNSSESGSKVIKIGTTGQSYPNSYKEGDKLKGFDVEVTEEVAKRLGYKVQWSLSDFTGIMGQLESGKIDSVANAVAVTDQRKQKYYFTDAYSYAGAQIVTNKNSSINSLADLRGKSVGGVLGSNNTKDLEEYNNQKKAGIIVKTYETREGAENDVSQNRIQGYINSKPFLIAAIKKKNLPLKFVGDPIKYETIAYPFAKTQKGKEFVQKFNTEIKKMHQDGTLKKISQKYFNNEDISVEIK